MNAIGIERERGLPLFKGAEWDFATLKRTYEAIEEVAIGELGLDCYPNQVEIITAEQMLDAYSAIGMPLFYHHWSFGKRFARDEKLYRKGYTGLAYEIVINSSPCISYVMEENTMTMQALVMAHAAFGHNHFFKNNYLFRQWTDAEGILDYLHFARGFVARCEERHGIEAVERVLDAAHALMDHGVDRYNRRQRPNLARELAREADRREHQQRTYNDLWARTMPGEAKAQKTDEEKKSERDRLRLGLPEENLLYFIEKFSPRLEHWERELLRIVRNVAQYFYPQKQTKVMNEGCATWVHYTIVNRLYDKGLLTEGQLLEFIDYHTRVVYQPDFDDPRYGGLNPYTLGFEMMREIVRIASDPTEEDRRYFPELAGRGDPVEVLKHAWANHRDDSFILQYLSPALIRRMHLFKIDDAPERPHLLVDAIHDERGYNRVRQAVARHFDISWREPDIQVSDVDFRTDRRLILSHKVQNGVPLHEDDARGVLGHIAYLWGYDVRLLGVDEASGATLYTYDSKPPGK